MMKVVRFVVANTARKTNTCADVPEADVRAAHCWPRWQEYEGQATLCVSLCFSNSKVKSTANLTHTLSLPRSSRVLFSSRVPSVPPSLFPQLPSRSRSLPYVHLLALSLGVLISARALSPLRTGRCRHHSQAQFSHIDTMIQGKYRVPID